MGRNQKGAAAVELAVLLPFLALLVFGTIEFALLMFNWQVVVNASREGARAGIIGYGADRETDTEISGIVNYYCTDNSLFLVTFDHVGDGPVTTVSPASRACGSGVSRGDNLTVQVVYDYYFLLPNLLGFGTKMGITASTTMKMESDDCPP